MLNQCITRNEIYNAFKIHMTFKILKKLFLKCSPTVSAKTTLPSSEDVKNERQGLECQSDENGRKT